MRGILSPYTFLVKLGFPAQTATNWAKETVGYIRPKQLEKLCVALNCTPNDLVRWHPDGQTPLADSHALNSLVRDQPPLDLMRMTRDLPPEKAAELGAIIESLK